PRARSTADIVLVRDEYPLAIPVRLAILEAEHHVARFTLVAAILDRRLVALRDDAPDTGHAAPSTAAPGDVTHVRRNQAAAAVDEPAVAAEERLPLVGVAAERVVRVRGIRGDVGDLLPAQLLDPRLGRGRLVGLCEPAVCRRGARTCARRTLLGHHCGGCW